MWLSGTGSLSLAGRLVLVSKSSSHGLHWNIKFARWKLEHSESGCEPDWARARPTACQWPRHGPPAAGTVPVTGTSPCVSTGHGVKQWENCGASVSRQELQNDSESNRDLMQTLWNHTWWFDTLRKVGGFFCCHLEVLLILLYSTAIKTAWSIISSRPEFLFYYHSESDWFDGSLSNKYLQVASATWPWTWLGKSRTFWGMRGRCCLLQQRPAGWIAAYHLRMGVEWGRYFWGAKGRRLEWRWAVA